MTDTARIAPITAQPRRWTQLQVVGAYDPERDEIYRRINAKRAEPAPVKRSLFRRFAL
jgi:hypothetical protein